jgi:diguanylate cyclase (GGDEF)-like protein
VRGHSHPAAAFIAGLSPAGRAALAGALLALAGSLLTGAAASPFLPLLVLAVPLVIRYVGHRRVPAAVAATTLLLLVLEAAYGESGWPALVRASAPLLAVLPGVLWRNEARRGFSAGTFHPASAAAGEPPAWKPAVPVSAAAERADLEVAISAAAARIGAQGGRIWDVDGTRGVAFVRAGGAPGPGVRLAGDPLGWAWEQDVRMRLEQAPPWAEPGSLVTIERLRRHDELGELLAWFFQPAAAPSDERALDEAAVYLRGVMGLQEARAGASAAQHRIDTLAAGIQRIPGELDVDSLAADLCLTACSLTGATGAVVGVWHGNEGELLGAAGLDGGPGPGDVFLPPYSELALAVRADTMLVRSAADWSLGRTCMAHHGERWTAKPRAMAALPLHGAAGTVGVLAVWTSREGALDGKGLELLRALSPYAALHLDHARAFGTLRDTAERDPLTLLRNRRAFDDIMEAEAARFERYQRPLSLLMLDIDHFKSVNDIHGHEAGDEVLRRTARVLGGCVRDVDTAARFGGEEFVILLPETSLDAALDVAGRICAAVAASPVPWRTGLIPLTISIGAAACPGSAARPADLIGAADEALYRAKREGRNRVCGPARSGASVPARRRTSLERTCGDPGVDQNR